MCMVACFLSAVAHNILLIATSTVVMMLVVFIYWWYIVAEYCDWIVVSKCTCGCCSAPA